MEKIEPGTTLHSKVKSADDVEMHVHAEAFTEELARTIESRIYRHAIQQRRDSTRHGVVVGPTPYGLDVIAFYHWEHEQHLRIDLCEYNTDAFHNCLLQMLPKI